MNALREVKPEPTGRVGPGTYPSRQPGSGVRVPRLSRTLRVSIY